MHRMQLTAVPTLAAALVAAATAVGFAQSDRVDLKDEVKALIELGWKPSRASREQAEREFQRLNRRAPGELRLAYAYVLVRIRQRNYPEAAKLLGEVLDSGNRSISPWRASMWETKIWLSTLTGQYDVALGEMEQLAKLLPGQVAAGKAEPAYHQTAGFLGRMCGYLEGPGADKVNAAAVANVRQRILQQMAASRATVFDQGRRSVVEQFSGAVEEADANKAAAEATAESEKERKLNELQQREEEVSSQTAAEEARLEEVRKQLTYELDQIAARERELAAEFRRIETAAAALRRELRILDGRIAELLALADKEEDPVVKQRYLDDAARWRIQRAHVLGQLTEWERRFAALGAERVGLLRQRQGVEARYRREGGRLEDLHRTQDRVRRERDRVSRDPITGNTPKVRDQKRRATALTTYISLPVSLEQQRKRLLDSFR